MKSVFISRLIFFGVFTVLCLGFPFSSLLAAPGVCSKNLEGLLRQSNGDIHLVLVSAVFLIGIYLFFSGVGLVNLSGCLLRLGMPSDYPNAVMRAFMYSQFRTDSNCLNSQVKEPNTFFGIYSGNSGKNMNKNVDLKHVIDGHSNTHILTASGEHKKRFKMSMKTVKARVILVVVSAMVMICVSYASFIVFEGSQLFLEPNSVILDDKGLGFLGYEPEFGNNLLLLFVTTVSIVVMNIYSGGVFILCILSWINFLGLLTFSFLSLYPVNSSYKESSTYIKINGQQTQFDWGIHIWGSIGGVLEIGAFVISSMSFHLILPSAFKLFTNYQVKSSRIWGITISLILFTFFCELSVVLGITPSFPIFSYGFEPTSEGIGISWEILESRFDSKRFFANKFIKCIFLLGSFSTWILFVSIVMKCIDNIIRSISNQIECDFDSFYINKSSSSKKYFLRSARQQICESEQHSNGDKYVYLSNNMLEIDGTITSTFIRDLKTTNREELLDLARYILNSASAAGIIFAVNYKLISNPQFIPIFKSISASLFSIVVLILPCAIFWFVFYSEMVPQSTSFFQRLKLVFFGRASTRYDRDCTASRDSAVSSNGNYKFLCNPLTFGVFSITLPVMLGFMILVYEISKITSLFLG